MIMESERYKATRAFDGSEDGWGDATDGDGAAHVRDCGGVEAEQCVHTP